jgi:hypothetical protein
LLHKAQLAPPTWSKIDVDASDFFKAEMLHEFTEFRLCEGSWKLDHWATLNYPSWFKNHVKPKAVSSTTKHTKKAKLEAKEPAMPNSDSNTLNDSISDLLNNMDLISMDDNLKDHAPGDSNSVSDTVGRPQPKPVWVR